MTPKLREAIKEEAQRLDELEDAVITVRSAGDFFAQLDLEMEAITEVRARAVRRLRSDGWAYTRIAAETGLSYARVAQLARSAGAGGRVSKKPTS